MKANGKGLWGRRQGAAGQKARNQEVKGPRPRGHRLGDKAANHKGQTARGQGARGPRGRRQGAKGKEGAKRQRRRRAKGQITMSTSQGDRGHGARPKARDLGAEGKWPKAKKGSRGKRNDGKGPRGQGQVHKSQ